MNRQRMFIRKVSYFAAMGVLLLPLFWLGSPSTFRGSPGGKLAQVRKENKLHRADLGQIDPASATMKLMTLGLDGFAESQLWSAAIDAKEREDWTTFGAALEQIKNLQPHSIKVWQFQAHNVSFNISCEFDDYRDRYRYVMKGIDMLTEGIRYNERNHYLVREEARFIGFKIGKSDEAERFRPMFRDDKDFHARNRIQGIPLYADRPEHLTDNWQVSRWWYQRGDDLLKSGNYGGLNSAVVHSDAPHSQMQYAKALETDGEFGEKARKAWEVAAEDWQKFGTRKLRTAAGLIVQLGTFDQQHRETEQARKEFEQALAKEPGLKEKLEAKRRSALSDAERTALDTKDKERGRQQQTLAEEAQAKLRLSHRDIAAGMTDAQHRVDALKLADRLVAAEYREHMVAMYRDIVNFKYWQVRCDVERRDETVKARRQIHEGDAALARSDIKGALEHYNSGLRQWWEVIKKDAVKDKESVLEKYPLLAEKSIVMELMQIIEKYEQQILKQNNLPLPQPFVLEPVKKANEEHERRDRQPAEVAGT